MTLSLQNVTKSYPDTSDGGLRTVLDGVTLSLSAGDRIAVTGPSGCGKSTLLNIIGTLDKPSSGEVRFGEREVSTLSEKEIVGLRAREIGFIFQLHHLLPQLSVLENVTLPSLAVTDGSVDPAESRARGKRLLERVGLDKVMGQKPHQLSGGERQRVAVVRALINKPSILLADEPTGALDQDRAGELVDLLIELNAEEETGLVLVSHDPVMAGRMDTVYHFEGGKLVRAEG